MVLAAVFLYRGLTFVPAPGASDFAAKFERAQSEALVSNGVSSLIGGAILMALGWFFGRTRSA
jgi:hypothetical protein